MPDPAPPRPLSGVMNGDRLREEDLSEIEAVLRDLETTLSALCNECYVVMAESMQQARREREAAARRAVERRGRVGDRGRGG